MKKLPLLTEAQINRIRPLGKVRPVTKGEILFEPGDTNSPFFVLLSGKMEIVQPGLEGERPIAKHDPGEFTGEMTMISGQRCVVVGRVTEAGEFLETVPLRLDEALRWVKDGTITDAKTVIGLLWWEALRRELSVLQPPFCASKRTAAIMYGVWYGRLTPAQPLVKATGWGCLLCKAVSIVSRTPIKF